MTMTPDRRVQRAVVFTALWVVAAAFVWFVPFGEGGFGQSANAQPQSNDYQPFQCASGGTTGQGKRASVTLSNNNVNGTSGGVAYPCISGVPYRFQVGNLTSQTANSVDGRMVAKVEGIYAQGSQSANWAANGNPSLVRMAFRGLTVCNGTTPSGCSSPGINNNDANTWNDMAMYASPVPGVVQVYTANNNNNLSNVTATNPRPTKDYVLRFAPDGPVTIGGSGVVTDLLADPNSRFSIQNNQIAISGTGCSTAGGNTVGASFLNLTNHTCQGIPASGLTNPLVQWLGGVADYNIRQLDLTFFYLINHSGTGDPYTTFPMTGGSPANSISLPNTRISVCQSKTACNPSLDYPHDD